MTSVELNPVFFSRFRKPWGPFLINDGKLRVFTAKLGPAGGIRGYEGITGNMHNSTLLKNKRFQIPGAD